MTGALPGSQDSSNALNAIVRVAQVCGTIYKSHVESSNIDKKINAIREFQGNDRVLEDSRQQFELAQLKKQHIMQLEAQEHSAREARKNREFMERENRLNREFQARLTEYIQQCENIRMQKSCDFQQFLFQERKKLDLELQRRLEQLYQNLSNQGEIKRSARAKRLLDRIEQLKRQTPPVINPPAPLPPPPPPRSELENAELVETKTNVHAGKVVAVAISPDCQTLVSGNSDYYNPEIKIWNLNSGALAHTISNYCSTINIIPDGEKFVITYGENYWIFNMQAGSVFDINLVDIGFNQCLAISQDGCQIACTVNNRIIGIMDIKTGESICSIVGHSRGYVTSAAFSFDKKTFVSGDSNGIIKIWRLGTAELPRILTGHSGAINFLAISPDGQNIVSCSADNTINIVNMDTGELLHTLTGNAKVIAISPDSQTLVSSGGKEINIWEMGTGQLLKTLGSYSPEVTSVAISSDGQMLVTGGSDGTIQIWRVR